MARWDQARIAQHRSPRWDGKLSTRVVGGDGMHPDNARVMKEAKPCPVCKYQLCAKSCPGNWYEATRRALHDYALRHYGPLYAQRLDEVEQKALAEVARHHAFEPLPQFREEFVLSPPEPIRVERIKHVDGTVTVRYGR
jgi:hypothetical protein